MPNQHSILFCQNACMRFLTLNMGIKIRCLSCRHLKIACDEARPKCEYCRATGRDCEYPEPKKRGRKKGAKSKLLDLVVVEQEIGLNGERLINCMNKQLGISRFEYHLLTTFHQIYIAPNVEMSLRHHTLSSTEQDWAHVWLHEVPVLWTESTILRKNVYAITAMFLERSVSVVELALEDSDESSIEKDIEKLTIGYFGDAISDTIGLIDSVLTAPNLTEHEAAEITFSAMLLFSFLGLQPYNLIPLIRFDSEGTDLIRFAWNMRKAMVKSFPKLFNTRYKGLFHGSPVLEPPEIKEKYLIVEYLRDELSKYESGYTAQIAKDIQTSISMLESAICRTVESNEMRHMAGYLFMVTESLYELMLAGDYFVLKILFFYSSLSLFCGFNGHMKTSIFLEFNDIFRNMAYERFGGWETQMDGDMYELGRLGFSFEPDFTKLGQFVPRDNYVIDHETEVLLLMSALKIEETV